jgi:hypothetical protein
VHYAVQTNKSFAIVPCCVFSSLFPNRRLRRKWVKSRRVQVKGQDQGQGQGESGKGRGEESVSSEGIAPTPGDEHEDRSQLGENEGSSPLEPVVSYDDLIQYLLQNAPGSKVAYLNFRGRNKVVYRVAAPSQIAALELVAAQ